MSRNNRNNDGGRNRVNVPKSVREFAEMTPKSHKKEYGEYFDSKKALRKDYFEVLITDLPDTIEWLLRNSHKQIDDVQRIKVQCYEKFAGAEGPDFIEALTKFIKNYGVNDIPKLEFLPIILAEMIADIIRENERLRSLGEAECEGPQDLYTLSSIIMKKRLKKAKKKGLSEEMMFDLLSIMPTPDAIEYSSFYRTRCVFSLIYQYAEKEPIPFETVIRFLYGKGENVTEPVITYALQERKDIYRKFNENQKKTFNDITTWVFNELEDMSKSDIRRILEKYIRQRKQDAAQGKDGNRRYFVSSLPADDYRKISKVVQELINTSEDNKKYL